MHLHAIHEHANATGVQLRELLTVERAAHFSTEALHADDPRPAQAAQVPGHERLADAKAPSELGDRLLALVHQDVDDPKPVDVAERAVVAPKLTQDGLAEQGSSSFAGYRSESL